MWGLHVLPVPAWVPPTTHRHASLPTQRKMFCINCGHALFVLGKKQTFKKIQEHIAHSVLHSLTHCLLCLCVYELMSTLSYYVILIYFFYLLFVLQCFFSVYVTGSNYGKKMLGGGVKRAF